MKRRSFVTLVCLFFGMVTTVAVAWGCVLLLTGSYYDFPELPYPRANELIELHTKYDPKELWGGYDLIARGRSKRGANLETVRCLTTLSWPPWQDDVEVTVRQNGWPAMALTGTHTQIRPGATGEPRHIFKTSWGPGVSSRHHDDVPTLFPLRPIWPGFLINTLFYAAIWFAMLFGIRTARRAYRRKRGICTRCGYNLRGQFVQGCPECGWKREP